LAKITNHEASHYVFFFTVFFLFLYITPKCHALINILTLPSSFNVGDRVMQPHKKRQNYSLGHTLIFILSHIERKTVDSERHDNAFS